MRPLYFIQLCLPERNGFPIDIEPETAIERMAKERFHTELFETKERLTEVRNRYLELIGQLKKKENIIIINGNQAIEQISDDIWQNISKFF